MIQKEAGKMGQHLDGVRWVIAVTQMIAERLAQAVEHDRPHLHESTAAGALARGRVLALAAYNQQAIESYREALSLDPCLHEAAARLVVLLLRTGQVEPALAAALKLAAEAPHFQLREMSSDESIGTLTLLGNALARNGRADDAIEAYAAARRVCGNDSSAAARLAQMYLATGEPHKALEQASAFADNPRFHDLASVLKLGKTSEALLPSFHKDLVASLVSLEDHGRPLSVGGQHRHAALSEDDVAWCMPVPDDRSP
jgi:tetratricopeptide (TPR) repeat protein